MRIVGGTLKGRRFDPPADKWPTRPTTDFSKEALFNILNQRIDFESVRMLDLFCGTGNHSYEFASRGCTSIVSVDKFGPAVSFVTKTAAGFGIADAITVIRSDALKFIEMCGQQFDYIFAGPPYGMPELDSIPDRIFTHNLLAENGTFVLEHNPAHNFKAHPRFVEERTYGQTHFSFFS